VGKRACAIMRLYVRPLQPYHHDGYYEWRTMPDGRKQPYRVTLKSGEPFAMAGIYTREPMEFATAEKNLPRQLRHPHDHASFNNSAAVAPLQSVVTA
jgi:putative SOS response-associated peptidase YedK